MYTTIKREDTHSTVTPLRTDNSEKWWVTGDVEKNCNVLY